MAAMICPTCGIEMNHHAEKLVLPSGPHEASSVDPVLGGMIEELHTCPRCGSGASRRAEPTRGE
ncbi:MAG: hypothetical protein E6J60_13540 [Deltaproteobacteria bacterium]|nr:MAG: hypothetical protein E6J60_13540 [Deltaproteobacteria bacterium]